MWRSGNFPKFDIDHARCGADWQPGVRPPLDRNSDGNRVGNAPAQANTARRVGVFCFG
jgi:hypothetical protein